MRRSSSPRPWAPACCVVAALATSAPAAGAEPTTPNPPAHVAPETITVTASPLTRDADSLATVVDSVDRDQILRMGGSNLADALADVPGVTGTSFASGASRPVIRGFDANRVRLLEDGIGSFDVSDVGPDHGVPIDPLSARRIEVIRGAGTLRYGSQAIGGVVNAIDDRVPLDLPTEPVHAEITGAYGDNADVRQGSGEVLGRIGSLALHADGFGRHADDYDVPHGTQENSFFRGDGYSGGGSYFFGPDDASRIGAAVVHYDAKYGIPSDDTYIDMRQTKELLRSSFDVGAGPLQTVTLDGGYASYKHSEDDPDGTELTTFRNKELDSRTEALFGPIGPFSKSAVGLQFQHRKFSALGEDSAYLFPTTTRSGAAFAFTQVPLAPSLNLEAGLRMEHVSIDGTPASDRDTSRGFDPASASLGLVYDASRTVRLGLTASSTGRAPAQTELFARGGHDGPGTFETGDPHLKVERANSLEATMRVRYEDVRVEAAAWVSKFDHYIFGALTGRTCDDDGVCADAGDGELRELNYTQQDATFRGAEGKASVVVYRGAAGLFEGQVLADFVRATLSDGGGDVPRIPPYHLGGGLAWSRGEFDASVLAKYSGAQHHPGNDETDTGSFTSLDAQIGWASSTSKPGWAVSLVGRNLTDSVQRNAVALNRDVVELPGRDVRFVVRATY